MVTVRALQAIRRTYTRACRTAAGTCITTAATFNGVAVLASQFVFLASFRCGRAGMAAIQDSASGTSDVAPPITRLTFAGTVPTAVAVLRAAGRVFAAHTLSFGSVLAVYLFALAVFQRIAGCASRTSVRIGTLCAVCGAITAFCAVACRYRIVFVLTAAACRIGRIRRSANRASFTGAFGTRTVRHSARDAVVAVDGCCRFVTVVAFTFVACAVRSRSSFGFGVALLARSYESLFSTGFLLCRAAPASSAAVASAVVNRCLTAAGARTEGVRSTAVAVAFGTQFRTVGIARTRPSLVVIAVFVCTAMTVLRAGLAFRSVPMRFGRRADARSRAAYFAAGASHIFTRIGIRASAAAVGDLIARAVALFARVAIGAELANAGT